MSPEAQATVAEAISTVFNTAPDVQPTTPPPVSMTKHYKGITLNQRVRIVDINPERATIQATQRRTFPCLDGEIRLRSGAFKGAIAAKIHPIDYAKGMFMLSELAYANWHERQSERVQPKSPTYVNLHYNNQPFRAYIEDISTDGMGILANRSIDPEDKLRVGVKVSLNFFLGQDCQFTHMKGMLVYRQKVGQQLIKFGLHIYPDKVQKFILQKYIIERRDEILDELDQTAVQSREPRRIENLFF